MESGQDSFLDIVSNIVGILIILVVIAGVRAKTIPPGTVEYPVDATAAEIIDDGSLTDDLVAAANNAVIKSANFESIQAEVQEIGEEIQHLQGLATARAQERIELASILGILKTEYDSISKELSGSQKETLQVQQQIQQIEKKLAEIERNKNWILDNRPQATVLENLPTPLAKKVDGDEVHFRIKGRKISHVPVSALIERMQADVQNRIFSEAKKGEISGNVGPIDNFTMPYRIVILPIQNRGGTATGYRSDSVETEFIPQNDLQGETLEQALGPNSEFRRRLAGSRQDKFTITIWVYPDSFNEYRNLKKFLFDQGYQTAARPLSFDDPIGASSNGTKSSAN